MKTMKVLSAGKVLRCALFALTGEATRPKISYMFGFCIRAQMIILSVLFVDLV